MCFPLWLPLLHDSFLEWMGKKSRINLHPLEPLSFYFFHSQKIFFETRRFFIFLQTCIPPPGAFTSKSGAPRSLVFSPALDYSTFFLSSAWVFRPFLCQFSFCLYRVSGAEPPRELAFPPFRSSSLLSTAVSRMVIPPLPWRHPFS